MVQIEWARFLHEWLVWSQAAVVDALEAVHPGLARTRPTASAPSVAFHAWHLARWADAHQAALAGWCPELDLAGPSGPVQIWVREDLARRWGMAGHDLGDYGGIGAGLDDAASAALPLPDPPVLVAYCRAAFAALEVAVERLDDALLERRVTDLYADDSSLADVVAGVISHTDRHLGMIEAVRGVLGERGTATV